jgi:diguanylate cyclase (GGDEF)-like protein
MIVVETLLPEMFCAESEIGRLEPILSGRAPALDQVSAYAGDRLLTDDEQAFFVRVQQQRGEQFYPDLLYAVTHQVFPPAVARDLWSAILRHKYELSELLKRNIRITVAALDYLGNLKGALSSATVIAEERMTDMVRLTQHDSLTKLFNHASFFQQLEQELRCYGKCRRVVTIMMIDVDDFKKINDRFGHPAGDLVLADLGAGLKDSVRAADICCRYGGEEFAVILPATGVAEGGLLAGRLLARLAQARPGGQAVTVSIGVAVCGEDVHTPHVLVAKADAALYAAKRQGKNRVVVDTL